MPPLSLTPGSSTRSSTSRAIPRPSSRTVTRRRPRRTRARISRCSGRSVFPCLMAFSTSGCTSSGGRRTRRAAASASTRHLELRAEARLLEDEVAADVAQLVVEGDELAGPREPAAQVVGEGEHQPPRVVGIRADERGDRVQGVEDEVRLHLRLERRASSPTRARRAAAAPTAGRRAPRAWRPTARRAATRRSRRRRPHRPARRRDEAARPQRRRAGRPGGRTRRGSRAARAADRSCASAS